MILDAFGTAVAVASLGTLGIAAAGIIARGMVVLVAGAAPDISWDEAPEGKGDRSPDSLRRADGDGSLHGGAGRP